MLYNWNLLGDGVHTVTAYADGVEFASVTVTVTTLGTEFLRGASGAFTVSDFPATGATRTLRWQQAQQNFVITAGSPRSGGTSGAALHILENPQPGSFQSGVGVISGWACEAQTIEISFDDGPRLQAGAGTIREDTHRVCGDTDNGFGLLYNWNLLGDGPHTVTAYADGEEFARVTVTVTTLGEEFRRGLSREVTVTNFPAAGTNVVLRWQQAQQNFVITQTTSTPVSTHFLPDANLRRAVGEALGKSPGATITKAELATLDRPFISDYDIVDLTGLEFATNLTSLFLYDGSIRDLAPLAGLAQLTELGLSSNQIVDLTPLAGLTNLTSLSLDFNDITDLAPLAGLAQLTGLGLSSNQIVDLTPLAGLTNLTSLSLDFNDITDLAPLAGLAQLTRLDLNDNFIRDLAPLAGLAQLTGLGLSSNQIVDLAPLAGLAQLTELTLDKMFATDLTPLFGLTKLAYLSIDLAPVSQEDLDTLAKAGVAIYGSPSFPGAVVDIHHDNVLVMHLPELPVAGFFDHSPYTRRIYLEFEDAFDYLVFVLNRDESPSFPYGGLYNPVRNDTQGIGRDVFSKRRYGSQKQLLGIIEIPLFGPLFGDFFGDPVLLHELMHRWANYVIPTPPGIGGHWGFSSADGQLGGFPLHDLVHLGGDRYKVQSRFGSTGNLGAYSPIELYLAGLIPPDEVPDLWVAEDGEWLEEDGEQVLSDDGRPIFTATKVRTITIDDIIAEHGERVPDWTTSQKDFRAAMVLLVDDDHPATPARIQEMSDLVSEFSHIGDGGSSIINYYKATGGRGSITTDGLSQFLLPD